MFRALLADDQEALYKRHLVYCGRIMSVGCGTVAICNRGVGEYVLGCDNYTERINTLLVK
jgi:hypothetical protein